MKKSLNVLLVLVLILSITGVAFAASVDIFSDVPAKHWAYGVLKNLSQAGIIEGYGDGTFRGDKTMTRYEMAIIVGNAVTKLEKADAKNKQLIDKLAQEFAVELNSIGTRVTKLEDRNKTDLRVGFDNLLLFSADSPPTGAAQVRGSDAWHVLNRLYLSGDVSPRTQYRMRVGHYANTFGTNQTSANGITNAVNFDQAYVTTQNALGFDSVRWGRQNIMELGGLIAYRESNNDGITLTKNIGLDTQFRVGAYVTAAAPAAVGNFSGDAQEAQLISLTHKLSKDTKVGAMVFNNNRKVLQTNTTAGYGYNSSRIYDMYMSQKVGDFTIVGEYAVSHLNTPVGNIMDKSPRAWAIQFSNGVNRADWFYPTQRTYVDYRKPHTDAFAISYRYAQPGAIPPSQGFPRALWYGSPAYKVNGVTADVTDNIKGWYFSYENVISKNVVLGLDYQDVKFTNSGAPMDKTFYLLVWVMF